MIYSNRHEPWTAGPVPKELIKCEGNWEQSDKHMKINLIRITSEEGREKRGCISGIKREELLLHLRKQVRALKVENQVPKCKRSCGQNDLKIMWINNEAQRLRRWFWNPPKGGFNFYNRKESIRAVRIDAELEEQAREEERKKVSI